MLFVLVSNTMKKGKQKSEGSGVPLSYGMDEYRNSRMDWSEQMKILIAEDDARLLKSLLHIFTLNRFSADGVTDGKEALEYSLTGEYDGLVFDIMMPGMDGIEVLRALRKANITTPALFLTARTEVSQRVEGLDAGADDYLAKPFSTAELLARVRAMLRRKENYTPELLTFKGLTLNRSTYEISSQTKRQALRGKEYQILEMLMEKPGMIVTAEQFLTHIWGWNTEIDTSSVWVHISNLRKKMDKIGAPVSIRFVRGAGYMLEEVP